MNLLAFDTVAEHTLPHISRIFEDKPMLIYIWDKCCMTYRMKLRNVGFRIQIFKVRNKINMSTARTSHTGKTKIRKLKSRVLGNVH